MLGFEVNAHSMDIQANKTSRDYYFNLLLVSTIRTNHCFLVTFGIKIMQRKIVMISRCKSTAY